jgi:hypothetical protein
MTAAAPASDYSMQAVIMLAMLARPWRRLPFVLCRLLLEHGRPPRGHGRRQSGQVHVGKAIAAGIVSPGEAQFLWLGVAPAQACVKNCGAVSILLIFWPIRAWPTDYKLATAEELPLCNRQLECKENVQPS